MKNRNRDGRYHFDDPDEEIIPDGGTVRVPLQWVNIVVPGMIPHVLTEPLLLESLGGTSISISATVTIGPVHPRKVRHVSPRLASPTTPATQLAMSSCPPCR